MARPWEEWTCSGCGKTNAEESGIEDQYSLGIFAGRYHRHCWAKSGFRKEGREGSDPAYAGESYDED